MSVSKCGVADVCPLTDTNVTINDSLTNNDGATSTYYIAGGISGAVLVGGAFAAFLFYNHRRSMDAILSDQVWANAAVSNPLYKNMNSTFDNPLYRRPKQEEDEDNGY